MIGNLYEIYYTGFFLWIITIPLAIYKGYHNGIKELKKKVHIIINQTWLWLWLWLWLLLWLWLWFFQ